MSPIASTRIHEADFCAEIASYSNAIFSNHPEYLFKSARIEGFGRGADKAKRKDLRVYDNSDRLILCGEVKLPGTPEGRSPYAEELVRDAHQKADNAGVQYFFTWNVNLFVLWDRKKWDVPLLDRRVREWKLGLDLASPDDAGRLDVLAHIKSRFLPGLFEDLAEICTGRRPDWPMPADDIFIRSMESHLEWPIALTRRWLAAQAERNKTFDSRLQEWMTAQDWTFVRKDQQEWFTALHRAASSLAYLLMNRVMFYKALCDRFEDLPQLQFRASAKSASDAYKSLQNLFERAVRRSGDYEPLFYPHERDWASTLVFEAPGAIQAWKGVLRAIRGIDFRQVSSDVLGRIFQRLIGPEERHRYGQHFTGDDVVDLINAFCIRTPDATVLDPACGSGSFLVRAYYRKKALRPKKSHLELLSELFGCDISLYPAHLATLNLAAREINEEANYPRIARRNFLHFRPDLEFCRLPSGPRRQEVSIHLPKLDAAVANPPYVRQEKIEKKEKKFAKKVLEAAWPGLRISGRSDLHCYFWPAAARLLKEDGYLGFLTSSSWLDVEYGFLLQAWVLQNFQIVAIMESNTEPWFPDARVKTSVTVMRRCSDEALRMGTLVKFVQFKKPLAEIIGVPPTEHETERQEAAQRLREEIEFAAADVADSRMRIIVKQQSELWEAGVRAGRIVGSTPLLPSAKVEDKDLEVEDDGGEEESGEEEIASGGYAAGKWGRYVRAPDFYFDVMREFGAKFAPLGSICEIRRGITSGCDAFSMPRDITEEALDRFEGPREFRRAYGVDRGTVAAGRLKIVQAGDGSVHPIEAEFLAPEVHSLMEVDRPVVRAEELDRVVLLVGEPISRLGGTHVSKYLKYGQTHTFASKKSKPVPVPKRSTCKARDPWYDLTKLVKPGFALWPKAQQYRHIAPANPDKLICNCNLYNIAADSPSKMEQDALTALLNSTLVGFLKTFYGRFAGTEGNLKTEVVDVNLLEVPNPRGISDALATKLGKALEGMQQRPVGRLVEEQLMDCHSTERAKRIAEGSIVLSNELRQPDRRALDDAVFELLGVADPQRRKELIDRLYDEAALHFRQIRVMEIQKMEQRRKSATRRFSAEELAADLWDAAELEDLTPLKEWIAKQPETTATAIIPDVSPAHLSSHAKMFDNETIYFGKDRKEYMICRSREEAELVKLLADLDVHGAIDVPAEAEGCEKLRKKIKEKIEVAKSRFEELANTRTSLEEKQIEVVELLLRWFVVGRPVRTPQINQ
jgi:methylase of polypeptide subunit release factors